MRGVQLLYPPHNYGKPQWTKVVEKFFSGREYFYTVENIFIQSRLFFTVENFFLQSRLFFTVEIIFYSRDYFLQSRIFFYSPEHFYTREYFLQLRIFTPQIFTAFSVESDRATQRFFRKYLAALGSCPMPWTLQPHWGVVRCLGGS